MRAGIAAARPAAFDVPSGGGFVGVTRDGTALCTTVALDAPPAMPGCPLPQTFSPATGAGPESSGRLPLALFDGWLGRPVAAGATVTVLTHGMRADGTGPAAHAYRSLLGPLPIAARRAVFLTVRTDALSAPDATAALRRTLSATRLLCGLLGQAGIVARPLAAAESGRLAERLGTGLLADAPSDDPGAAPAPDELCAQLESVWSVDARSATTALLLSRDGTGPRPYALARIEDAGWQRLPGGLAPAAAPTGRLPLTGAGILIGAAADGTPVTFALAGPQVPRAAIHGSKELARRLVVRLIGVGHSVAVHTDRPHCWAPLVAAVGDPARLRPAGTGSAEILLHDHADAEIPDAAAGTVLTLTDPTRNPRSGAVADAPPTIRQLPGRPAEAIVVSGGRSLPIRLIGAPAEDALVAVGTPAPPR